jgi:Protein of unknown function (DUF3435)
MNRHRDHLAPSDLTDEQLKRIGNFNRIRRLWEQRIALKNEMRALYGTLKKPSTLILIATASMKELLKSSHE